MTNDYYGIGHENQAMLSEEAAVEKQMRARILVDMKKKQKNITKAITIGVMMNKPGKTLLLV